MPAVEPTTTFFVPQSKDSHLFQMIKERNELTQNKYSWAVKVIEQSGSPLLLQFFYKFPNREGCPRGEKCTFCDQDGVKCSKRSVVYSATCEACHDENEIKKINRGDLVGAQYNGKTSRPVREHIIEHLGKIKKFGRGFICFETLDGTPLIFVSLSNIQVHSDW